MAGAAADSRPDRCDGANNGGGAPAAAGLWIRGGAPGLRWRSADGARRHGSGRRTSGLRIRDGRRAPAKSLATGFLSGGSTRCSAATVPALLGSVDAVGGAAHGAAARDAARSTGRSAAGIYARAEPDHGSGIRRTDVCADDSAPEKTGSQGTRNLSADRSASDRGRCGRLVLLRIVEHVSSHFQDLPNRFLGPGCTGSVERRRRLRRRTVRYWRLFPDL